MLETWRNKESTGLFATEYPELVSRPVKLVENPLFIYRVYLCKSRDESLHRV
jgi:hypothetical protein